ncbi:S24 family peptidase [Thermaurantiacus sp.]
MTGDEIRRRLDELIRARGTDYLAVSRLLGRNPAYIQQFIKRGVPRHLGERDRRLLAAHFGVDEAELGGPSQPQGADQARDSQSRRVLLSAAAEVRPTGAGETATLKDYVLIPYLTAHRSTAPASGRDALAFETGFARQVGSGRLGALSALLVEGDSMSPSLLPGDQILVDLDDCAPLRDGLYTFEMDGGFSIRRVSVHPVTGRPSLLPDNPAYASFTDCDPEALKVLGRVVWIGRKLP